MVGVGWWVWMGDGGCGLVGVDDDGGCGLVGVDG